MRRRLFHTVRFCSGGFDLPPGMEPVFKLELAVLNLTPSWYQVEC